MTCVVVAFLGKSAADMQCGLLVNAEPKCFRTGVETENGHEVQCILFGAFLQLIMRVQRTTGIPIRFVNNSCF